MPAEDRLLFRFNTRNGEEYRLKLTRQFLLILKKLVDWETASAHTNSN